MSRLTTLIIVTSLALPAMALGGDKPTQGEWDEFYKTYKARDDLARHKEAAIKAAQLAESYPEDRDAQRICVLTGYYCGHRITDDAERKKVAGRGIVCAERILARSPKDYDGRYWASMTTFKSKSADGIRASLKEATKIKKFLEQMIKDEPKRFEAYMMLGTLYRELPPLLTWGNPKKGLELLQKAFEFNQTDPDLLLELAAGYAKVGRKEEARTYYDKCINDSVAPKDMKWETQDAIDYAKKMKKKLDD